MKQPSFVALSLLAATLGITQAAQAEEIDLDFSLSAEAIAEAPGVTQPASPTITTAASAQQKMTDPAFAQPEQAVVAPPRVAEPVEAQQAGVRSTSDPEAVESPIATATELSFALSTVPQHSMKAVLPTAAVEIAPTIAARQNPATGALAELFAGGSESLVAKAVGSAEGTRTPRGDRTLAYYGHVDPGNGVWNVGSFSYQHGARTPEEADAKQLKRLALQAEVLRQQAAAKGMTLTVEEVLNAIDLANQAPVAALDRGGYMDWLDNAHKMGLRGSEAILWARTRSFLNPDTRQWNAPGLGNNVYSISSDQERRMQAIARAIADHPAQPNQAIANAP